MVVVVWGFSSRLFLSELIFFFFGKCSLGLSNFIRTQFSQVLNPVDCVYKILLAFVNTANVIIWAPPTGSMGRGGWVRVLLPGDAPRGQGFICLWFYVGLGGKSGQLSFESFSVLMGGGSLPGVVPWEGFSWRGSWWSFSSLC